MVVARHRASLRIVIGSARIDEARPLTVKEVVPVRLGVIVQQARQHLGLNDGVEVDLTRFTVGVNRVERRMEGMERLRFSSVLFQ